jgi:glutamyl-tRNA synthetase
MLANILHRKEKNMAITRFAPSPTGFLHVGSARTALYCWLWAKHHLGKFILRIEDTDRARSSDEAVEVILDGLKWLGLDWDGEPIFQTNRMERYKEIIQKLLDSGHAYKCYCSKERLESLRESQMSAKQKPKYDGKCRHSSTQNQTQPFVIRFKTPEEGSIAFRDLIKGKIEVSNQELDDLIIARADTTPTYNLTVVVDDLDMNISHVLRGDDHINNTPRQIHIFNALGATAPEYAHMPMLLGPDGKKYSKRQGAASVLEFAEQGILPEALINYLVRLGWSHGDQEIFSLDELIEYFDISSIHNSAAQVNPDKLAWLNQHYLKTLDSSDVAKRLKPFLEKQPGVELNNGPDLVSIVEAHKERANTLVQMAEQSALFFSDQVTYDEKAFSKHMKPAVEKILTELKSQLTDLNVWEKPNIHDTIHQYADTNGLKFGKIGPPLRIATTGGMVSPAIDVTLYLLGKKRTLDRIEAALDRVRA